MVIDRATIARLCVAHDIATLRLFGSAARGDEQPDSDVDMLVRFSKPKSLLELIRVEEEFSKALGRPVDLVTEGALSPHLRERVIREARMLYDAA